MRDLTDDSYRLKRIYGVLLFLLPFSILFALYRQQYYLRPWQAATAHLKEAIVVNDASQNHLSGRFVFITGRISGDGIWKFSNPQASSGKQSSSSFSLQCTTFGVLPQECWHGVIEGIDAGNELHVGQYVIPKKELQNIVELAWHKASMGKMRRFPSSVEESHLVLEFTRKSRSTSARVRQSFLVIPDDRLVTMIGQLDRSGNPVISKTPLMPASYPALWPGKVSPEDFIQSLKKNLLEATILTSLYMWACAWLCLFFWQKASFLEPHANIFVLGVISFFAVVIDQVTFFMLPHYLIAALVFVSLVSGVFLTLRLLGTPVKTNPDVVSR